MNRQSIMVFADFNNFESPRGSQHGRRGDESWYGSEDYEDTSDNSNSLASSTYWDEKQQQQLPEPPYHVFSLAQKKRMVYIVSLAGLFSPLSSNIYFPALGQISRVCDGLQSQKLCH